MSEKPIVQYRKAQHVQVGRGCLILPMDHPGDLVSNTTWAITSPVVKHDPVSGIIETLNTIYQPGSGIV